jgi:hypothetical protein
LHGIITSKCFWASDLLYMNDYKEGAWFAGVFAGCIDRCDRLSKDERENLLGYTKMLPRLYALSCSENGDCLSQWRAYAVDGAGFAIGITPRTFLREYENMRVSVCRVVYEEEEQDQRASEILQRYLAARDGLGELPVSHKEAWLLSEFMRLAFISKNPAFHEEQEWRLICEGHIPLEQIATDVRVSGNNLVPYVELTFPTGVAGHRLGIVEIVFGPKNDMSRNLEPLWRLLKLNGFDPAGIQYLQSNASLR